VERRKPSGGISFTDASGNTLEIGGEGGAGSAQLNKVGANLVQTKAINAAEVGARMAANKNDFKPECLTLGTKLHNYYRSGLAKIDPKYLSSEDTRGLLDFAKFQSRTIGNLNRVLNELSGAAVSPPEAVRIRAEMPDPGSGWFDGDDPISFQAKQERVLEDANAALARYRYYQAVGIPNNLEDIPLADVRQVDGKWYIKQKDGKVVEAPQ
jgi:hypothetical protein